jgi:hypothetical protein
MFSDFSETTLASETSNGQRETTSFPPYPGGEGRGGEGKQLWGVAEGVEVTPHHSAARELGRLGQSLGI